MDVSTTPNTLKPVTFELIIEILTEQQASLDKCIELAHAKFASGEWTAQQRMTEVARAVNVRNGLARSILALQDAIAYNKTIALETELV